MASVALMDLLGPMAKTLPPGRVNLAEVANELVDNLWATDPDTYGGRYGQRPHKLTIVASALALAVSKSTGEDYTRYFYAHAFTSVVSVYIEMKELYPLSDLDHLLMEDVMDVYRQFDHELQDLKQAPLSHEFKDNIFGK